MTNVKLTNKQKEKLRNLKYVRPNSNDITVNPRFKDDVNYDSIVKQKRILKKHSIG